MDISPLVLLKIYNSKAEIKQHFNLWGPMWKVICQWFHFSVKLHSSFMVSMKVVGLAVADINLVLIQSAQSAYVLH